uniref:Uncharacterized protein n=1 Tax=Anopheles merus TaxID=30066 RepID=A0A182VIZ6_ANOME
MSGLLMTEAKSMLPSGLAPAPPAAAPGLRDRSSRNCCDTPRFRLPSFFSPSASCLRSGDTSTYVLQYSSYRSTWFRGSSSFFTLLSPPVAAASSPSPRSYTFSKHCIATSMLSRESSLKVGWSICFARKRMNERTKYFASTLIPLSLMMHRYLRLKLCQKACHRKRKKTKKAFLWVMRIATMELIALATMTSSAT